VGLDQRVMWQLNRLTGIFVLGAGMLMSAGAAVAGDRALAETIGYSQDARYFAFEEFGIQDGSGFAYSHIYVIDLAEDRWVVGTPIIVEADEDTETLKAIRERSREQSMVRLNDLEIDRPAQIAAYNGDGTPDIDGLSISFGVPGFASPGAVTGAYDVSLEIYAAKSGAPCLDWFGENAMGFSLSIEDYGVVRQVHQDRSLPRSRGCPITYRITGVYLPFEATDISRAVALISVYAYGFEGADRRFVAVPLAYSF